MKIKELIKILKEKENQDMEVIMSKDGEGNAFSPLAELGDGLYSPDSTYSGQVYNLDEREEAGKEAKKVIVLWPTN